MDLTKLNSTLKSHPSYRLKQAYQVIFKDLIEDWQKATILPLELREELNKKVSLEIKAKVFKGKKSSKALLYLKDGQQIETVLMRHTHNRNTVCVSCQAGCAMNCRFCATGKTGFKRNLEVSEILAQVLFFARILKKEEKKISNIVFMGMGEPFLNYKAVMEAVRLLNDEQKFGLGARKISISTVGIISGIKKFAQENLQVNLAVSLHFVDQKMRDKFMPGCRKTKIDSLLKEVRNYGNKTKRKVMIEYLLLKNINDSREDAEKLAENLRGMLAMVNLIEYNQTDSFFKKSSKSSKEEFKKVLENRGVEVTLRQSFGNEFSGACGQLAGKVK